MKRTKSKSENYLRFLEKDLTEQQFLGGDQPTFKDNAAYKTLLETDENDITAKEYPYTFAWFNLIN